MIGRQFAQLVNYDTGPATGTATKIAADISDTGLPTLVNAQLGNYLFAALSEQTLSKLIQQATTFGPDSPPPCNAADAIAACSDTEILRLAVGSTEVVQFDEVGAETARTASAFTAGAAKAAFVPSLGRMFAAGYVTSGNVRGTQYTDDKGAAWSATQTVNTTSTDRFKTFIYNPFDGFLYAGLSNVTDSSSANNLLIYRRGTSNSDTWSLRATLSCHRDRHMVAGPDRLLLLTCDRTTPALIAWVSVDAGATWASNTITEVGGGHRPVGLVWDPIYERFVLLVTLIAGGAGASMRVYTSPDGANWTHQGVVSPNSGGDGMVSTGNDEGKLLYFKGVLFALVTGNGSQATPCRILASTNGGSVWREVITLCAGNAQARLIDCTSRIAAAGIDSGYVAGTVCGR